MNNETFNIGDIIEIKDYKEEFPLVLHPVLGDREYEVLDIGNNTAGDITYKVINDIGEEMWIWYKFVKKIED